MPKAAAKAKEKKSPAKSTRDYSLAKDLPARLKPESSRRNAKPIARFTVEDKRVVKMKKTKTTKKTTKKGKKKDPNAPKRPLSAYMLYCKAERPAIMKKHPDERITEIAKRLGEAWKKVSVADKKKFEKDHEKDKTRYEKEIKAYKKK